MKIFGIDPGSERTGYGCIELIASRHHLVIYGSLSAPARATFPEKLQHIHRGLGALLATHRPDCVAVETIFYSRNVRSALKLGEARGIALLPKNYIKLEGKAAQQMLKLMEILEEHEDTKKVWTNADIEEKEIEASLA